MIATDIARESGLLTLGMRLAGLLRLTKNVSQGAATTLLCTLNPAEQLQGQYWSDCQPTAASWRAVGADGEAAAAVLWTLSERLVSESADKSQAEDQFATVSFQQFVATKDVGRAKL